MLQAAAGLASGASPDLDRRVFAVADAIDADTVGPLRQRLLEHLDAYGPQIAIDLSGVDFIDSTGLGALVGLLREARDRGGDVRLLHPTRQVRRILQITGLEAIFGIEAAAG